MKIILGITYYQPNISGVTIYARRLAEELLKRGHRVVVITSRYDQNLPAKEVVNGVEIIRVPVGLKIGKGVLMPLLPFYLLAEIKDCQVINCHLPQFESFVFALLGKIFRKKVILTHHTDLSGWSGSLNRLSEMAVWSGQLLAGLLADKIVPYTQDYAEHSWYLKLFKEKLAFILPPIMNGRVEESLKKKWLVQAGHPKLVIGFAGRIAKQKGLPYLLRSIPYLRQELPSFKIVFAGPYQGVIGESYYTEIFSLIRRYQKSLCFLGSLSEEKMASFYSLCDVLVLPSDDRLESFGLVQVEAMMTGCPVVATNLPGVRVPIQLTGMGELVAASDSRALAEGIIRVIKNKKKYFCPIAKLKRIFSLNQTIRQYEQLFEENRSVGGQ